MVVLASGVTACSTLTKVKDNDWASLALRYAVHKGVTNYVGADMDRVQGVIRLAQSVGELLDEDRPTSVARIISAVRDEISWDSLTPEDYLLLDGMILNVGAVLETKLGDDVIDPAEQVAVRDVLAWAVQAASFTAFELQESQQ